MQNLTIEVDFDRFPPEHTCDGDNISPRIRVSRSDAPYLAVIMDDPDDPTGTFTHWIAWNIPSTGEIPMATARRWQPTAAKKHLRSRLRPREGPESPDLQLGREIGARRRQTRPHRCHAGAHPPVR
ncbi:MAG: hypothetical protein GX965_09720 [Methanoculleus bourgensis]|nr:hypothetical protein [Methanoculleus bourgensis]